MRDLLGKATFYIFIFLIHSWIFAIPECSLDIRGSDGAALSTVGSGVPFQVIVTMRNCTDQPHVEIDDAPFALLRRVSVQTRVINGNSSVSYIYTARIDGNGPYEVGPARVVISGTTYETNTCAIEVGGQEKVVGARFIMQVSCDDDIIYVGQETVLRVRIYSATSVPEVESLHMPKVDGISLGELRENASGTEYIEKVKYRYREFLAPLSAQKIGKILIPAHSADVRDDQARRGSFGFFFSTIAPTKQIYSNSCSLEVCPLPVSDKSTSLIGDYTSLSAVVDPDIITLGQAVKYKLTIIGTGNALKITPPLLADMPSSCKYYDSSTVSLDIGGAVFEYIVQPREAGTWEIPSQEIVYFDPKKREYCTVCSQEVVITVLPVHNQEHDTSTLSETCDNKNILVSSGQQFHPDLCSADPVHVKAQRIPWFWYWVLIIVGTILCCGYFFIGACILYYNKNRMIYRSRCAFYSARRSISDSEKRGEKSNLYDIFITFFADWFMVEKSCVTEDFIQEKLFAYGFLSEDGVESWNRFWYKVVHEQYGVALPQKIDKTIYAEARLWIAAFSKVGMQ